MACCKRFANIDLAAGEGEISPLVGANGAGKTTLLRTIAGAHRPFPAASSLTARMSHRCGPIERVALGIALVPEGRKFFAGLTVEENLRVAGDPAAQAPGTSRCCCPPFPMLRGAS